MSEPLSSGIGISRGDLLGGMPARRASTIVFAIENLTSQLVARSRRALARYQPAATARDRERQFIDAVSGGRDREARPQIQDVERYAPEWAHMVPDGPDVRAAILHQLASRYVVPYDRAPRIRSALAADSPAVADAYRRQHGTDIASAWKPVGGPREKLRWWRARVAERVETMPPFWMAFSVTLTETIGGGMLAIPIALAGVGVPVALLLLIVFGLINIVTIAALVEAIVRDGRMRYGSGYFGQLVENRLGRAGGIAIGVGMYALNALGLLVALVGFGTVLAATTGVSPLVWVALLFAATVVVLRRESLDATVAAALLVGVAILAMAVGMIVLGLLNVRTELLFGAPQTAGAGSTSVIALVFGVLLYVYFGHTSAANVARQVLRRDPTGRTLLWGNVAAMGVSAVIYCLFVVAVNGSVPAARLAAETGTGVAPLAEVAGPLVGLFGSIYVVLSLGIGAVLISLGLYLQTAEYLAGPVGLSRAARFAVAALPAIAVFALVELLLWLGSVSFTGPLNLVGALVLPLMGGVFPMLLLAAARRRGERVPGTSLRWLGSPVVVVLIVALYLGGVVAHALFIWTDPLERLVAGATAVGMVAVIAAAVARRSFAPRTVVELRADEAPGTGMTVAVIADGHAVSERRIDDLTGVEPVAVDLPSRRPSELHIWAHRPTRDGDTQPLPVDAGSDPARVPDATDNVVIRPTGSWLGT